jgi:hypothetical protein
MVRAPPRRSPLGCDDGGPVPRREEVARPQDLPRWRQRPSEARSTLGSFLVLESYVRLRAVRRDKLVAVALTRVGVNPDAARLRAAR